MIVLDCFDDPGRDPSDDGVGGHVSGDDGPGSHDGVFTDRDSREDSGVGS